MPADRTESVERAMSILLAFGMRRPRLTLAELAAETGLHKSTILRLVRSMATYGFIVREEDGRYSIGASVWHLGLIFRQDFPTGETVRPVLRRLVEATDETASFFVRAGNDRVCLYRENSPNLEKYGVEEGMRLRLDTGASGIVLRANTEAPDRRASGPARSPETVNLNSTRNPNIASISTPVVSRSGRFRGALTVSGPNTRFVTEIRTAAIPMLEKAAAELGAKIA